MGPARSRRGGRRRASCTHRGDESSQPALSRRSERKGRLQWVVSGSWAAGPDQHPLPQRGTGEGPWRMARPPTRPQHHHWGRPAERTRAGALEPAAESGSPRWALQTAPSLTPTGLQSTAVEGLEANPPLPLKPHPPLRHREHSAPAGVPAARQAPRWCPTLTAGVPRCPAWWLRPEETALRPAGVKRWAGCSH